ncbi:MAG: TIGR03663 family protein, partial [Acidobacteria bacterium]|nr:TIGR03663 family protein [Acidobacteriota bacterium]
MGTASTKSRSPKQQASRAQPQTPEAPAEAAISERTWLLSCAAILLIAAFLRLYDLNLVPLHHDEGVNGNFLVRLVREGAYQYDPQNYHGPTLYYFAAFFPWILRLLFGPNARDNYGLTTFAIRFVPAFFGVATIALILTLRRNLGMIATLGAAVLLAISPGAVYLSRYFIHETLFVFFTLGIVVASLKYFESSRPVYLILAAPSAALLFATKETAVISVAVLGIALVLTLIYRSFWARSLGAGRAERKKKGRGRVNAEGDNRSFVERAGGPGTLTMWLVVALIVFIAVNVLFYSSFFT